MKDAHRGVQGGGAKAPLPFPTKARHFREAHEPRAAEGALPNLLTVAEAATYLRTTRKAIYAMVERGQVAHLRIGRRVLFSVPELLEWLRHKSIAVTTERAA